jgi:MFS family permease
MDITASPIAGRQVTDLSFLFNHAAHVLATRMSAAFAEIGITPRDYCVLAHAMGGEYTQIELAKLAGGLLLLSGRLGDLLGRKRVLLAGLTLFVVASLACGLAAGDGMLIGARFVQGAGAAMASAAGLGMIVRLFSRPAEQARATGAFAFTGAVGASAGLVIGGRLVQYASWHWIFFVNLPVGLVTGIAGWRVLAPDTGIGLRAGADWIGALLATAGVMCAVFAIAARQDWWAGLGLFPTAATIAVVSLGLSAPPSPPWGWPARPTPTRA